MSDGDTASNEVSDVGYGPTMTEVLDYLAHSSQTGELRQSYESSATSTRTMELVGGLLAAEGQGTR